jgi:hypothetical protein
MKKIGEIKEKNKCRGRIYPARKICSGGVYPLRKTKMEKKLRKRNVGEDFSPPEK